MKFYVLTDTPGLFAERFIKMKCNVEYIKLFWEHEIPEEPVIILYKVNLNNERLAIQSIDIFADRKTKNIEDLYEGVLEITSIPTVEEFNIGIWGEEFYACLITGDEFETIWNAHYYSGDLYIDKE